MEKYGGGNIGRLSGISDDIVIRRVVRVFEAHHICTDGGPRRLEPPYNISVESDEFNLEEGGVWFP